MMMQEVTTRHYVMKYQHNWHPFMSLFLGILACLSFMASFALLHAIFLHSLLSNGFLVFFGVFYLIWPYMLLTSAPSFFGRSWCYLLVCLMMYMPFPCHPPPSTASLYLPMPSRCLIPIMFVGSSPVNSWLTHDSYIISWLMYTMYNAFSPPFSWCCPLRSHQFQRILCWLQCNSHWKSGWCCHHFMVMCVWVLFRSQPLLSPVTVIVIFHFFSFFCLWFQSPTVIQIFVISLNIKVLWLSSSLLNIICV